MVKWSNNRCIYFNAIKCNFLHSGKNCDYFMSLFEAKKWSMQKDLGVTFDHRLNFSHHIYNAYVSLFMIYINNIYICIC